MIRLPAPIIILFGVLFPLALLAISPGCSDYQINKIGQNDGLEEFDTANDEEYESAGEGVVADGCDNIVITDADGEQYEVGAYLTFGLDFPYGDEVVVDEGFPNVLIVKATAHCDDVAIESLNFFMTGEDHNGSGWISHINETSSKVWLATQNEYFGIPFYGENNGIVGVTEHGLWWPVELNEPEVIQAGESIFIGLATWFSYGFVPAPKDRFHAELDGRASWYGLDSPDTYPTELLVDRVVGAPMRFDPVDE